MLFRRSVASLAQAAIVSYAMKHYTLKLNEQLPLQTLQINEARWI